jgi:peptidoglycan/xylan/chitin deacetylase (PgdA/CDA1 family)
MDRFSIKQNLKSGIFTFIGGLCFYSGLTWMRREMRGANHARILNYHKVNDHWPNLMSIPVAQFSAQMKLLADHYHVVSMDEIASHLEEGTPFEPGTVALTFDDGYRDNYTNAFPILKKHGLPFLVFRPVARIGGEGMLDHDRAFESGFNPLLSWDQVREMRDNGGSFGSHTLHHTVLTKVSEEKAQEEIERSKELLSKELGEETRYFAYPVGTKAEMNSTVKAMVKKAGYQLAFSGIAGCVTHDSDMYELRRCNIERGSLFLFERILDGSLDILAIKDTKLCYYLKKLFNLVMGTPS